MWKILPMVTEKVMFSIPSKTPQADQAHGEQPGPQIHYWCLSSHTKTENLTLPQNSHFSMFCYIATSLSQFPISAAYAPIQPTDTLQQLNKSVSRSLESRPIRGDPLLVLVPGHGYYHWTWTADWHFGLTLVVSHSSDTCLRIWALAWMW